MPKFGTLTPRRNQAPAIPKRASEESSTSLLSPALSPGLTLTPAEQSQGGVSIPMIMATIMVFMQLGRPFDQILPGYHIPAIVGSVAIVVMFFTPWLATLRTKVGISLILLIVIMAFASIFSLWRGGSVAYLQQYIELNMVVFCLLGAAPATVGQIRWLAIVALLGCVFEVAVGSGIDPTGRLYLTDATFGNSDDVALIGGVCIPLVLLLAFRLGKVFGTLVGVVGVIGCLAIIGLAAARFGLISLAVMALVYFFRASGGRKIALVICFCLLAVGAVFLLPKSTIERFSTITTIWNSDGDDADGGITSEALASMQERKQLSKDALQAFITHPLLGVGPDVFVDWRWDVLHRRGQPAHDTYLQAAAESGIFGVAFYVAFLLSIVMALQRSTKQIKGWEDGRQIALALQPCMVYFIVSALFLNCLSHAHQFVFAGLAIALERVRRQQSENTSAEQDVEPVSTAASLPAKDQPLRTLPPRTRTEEIQPSVPARPARYRFNRPIASSGRD